MNTSKVIFASLIGAIINFLAGWIIYGILLKSPMEKAMTPEAISLNKPEPNLAGIFIAGVITAFLIAYIFERWAKINTFIGGLTAGGLLGLLFAAGMDIQIWSMVNMWSTPSYIFVDILSTTVMWALIGGGIGWFLGRGRQVKE